MVSIFKIGIVGLVFCVAAAVTAAGQVVGDAPASVSVVGGLTVNTLSNISFGQYTAGDGSVTLDPATGLTTPTGGGTPSAGQFQVQGTASATIAATYPASITLTEPNSGSTLTMSTSVIANKNNDPGTATAYTSGTQVSLDNQGYHYFWVGGSLTVGANSAGGTFSGTFTLSVSYN